MSAAETEPQALSADEIAAGVRVLEQRLVASTEPTPGVTESVWLATIERNNGRRGARVLITHENRSRRVVFIVRHTNLVPLLEGLTKALDEIDADKREHAAHGSRNRFAWRALRLPRELLDLADATGESIEAVVRRAAMALLEREQGETRKAGAR